MNREDIIRMAREAGLYDCIVFGRIESKDTVIERFAALVAAAEREAIIKAAEDMYLWHDCYALIKFIEARGQA